MKFVISLIGLLAASQLASAAEIVSYQSVADIGANGDAQVSSTLTIRDAKPGPLVLPVGFTGLNNLSVGAPVRLIASNDKRKVLQLELPADVPAEFTFDVRFDVPALMAAPKVEPGKKPELSAGSALVRHRFVNTQEATIENYGLTVRLPDGIQVHEIVEQTPKPKRTDVLPRVRLDADQGRQTARLQFSGVKQGDSTAMVIETVPVRRSIGWLLAGLALGVFYLLNFKDLVARKPA